jgi:hypothetical protein
MKKLILVMLAAAILISCKASNDPDREGYYYDKFRGDDSSIINLTQYESFSKCLGRFDLTKYRDSEITYSLNAPNDFVATQINSLVKSILNQNDIRVADATYDGKGNRIGAHAEKYDLQFTAICGGYHFYNGLLLKNYSSITRLVLVENDIEKKKITNSDSGYQEYRYGALEFTDIFQVFFYALLLLVVAVLLVKFVLLKTKKQILK